MSEILGGLLWRFRGVYGWPFTLLFALECYYITGKWWYALWVFAGEGGGWKPKLVWDYPKSLKSLEECAIRGFAIGGLGAILVPVAGYLKILGEPSWPRYEFTHTVNGIEKRPFDWKDSWHEFWFGLLFILILGVIYGNH